MYGWRIQLTERISKSFEPIKVGKEKTCDYFASEAEKELGRSQILQIKDLITEWINKSFEPIKGGKEQKCVCFASEP